MKQKKNYYLIDCKYPAVTKIYSTNYKYDSNRNDVNNLFVNIIKANENSKKILLAKIVTIK